MKRKIIGIFIIAVLTISSMPIINSEEFQVQESYKSKDSNIRFFFIENTKGVYIAIPDNTSLFLTIFGIYKDVIWVKANITKNYIFMIDGKIKNLEPPCTLILYNFTGFGTPLNILWILLKAYMYLWNDGIMLTLFGSCESYEIRNEAGITI